MKTVKRFLICIALIILLLQNNTAMAAVSTGRPATYAADIKDIYTNNSQEPVRNIVIIKTLRGDEDNTHLYALLNKKNIYLKPANMKTDEKGNMLATFKIPRLNPGESVTVGEKLYFTGQSVKYNLTAAGVGTDYSSFPQASLYLKPSERIESDNPAIVQTAAQIVGGETNPLKKARLIYGFVNSYITYDPAEQYSNKGALSALITSRGVCYEFSSLMVALLRSSGVPARMVAGYKVENNEINQLPKLPDGTINLSESAHAWVEFYLPGIGWIPSEPTVKYTINGKKHISWDYFTGLDSSFYIPVSIDSKMESKWSSIGHLTLDRIESLQVNPPDFAAPAIAPRVIPAEEPGFRDNPANFIKNHLNLDTLSKWLDNKFPPFLRNLLGQVPPYLFFLVPAALLSIFIIIRSL